MYDLEGNYKRTLKQHDDMPFLHMYNFDREHLICNNDLLKDNRISYRIISKQDGSITKEIKIPFEVKIEKMLTIIDEATKMIYAAYPRTYKPIIPSLGNWILTEFSSDTIYRYSPDHTMEPVIVRTPPVKTDPDILLITNLLTDNYYFIESVRKEFDFKQSTGFPAISLVYDKRAKAIYKYVIYNSDYVGEINADMKSYSVDGIALWQQIEAFKLIEIYKNGKLKGKLKEIAATLSEDDNPVIMLAKYKE